MYKFFIQFSVASKYNNQSTYKIIIAFSNSGVNICVQNSLFIANIRQKDAFLFFKLTSLV
jgi:hypothetical protein